MNNSNDKDASLLDTSNSSCGSATSPINPQQQRKESADSQFTKVLWQSNKADANNTKSATAPTATYNDNHLQSMLKSNYNNTRQPVKPRNSGGPNGASQTRQMLPVIVCLITFATVLSVLIIYMDTTEIRHQQFRLNMTRDYDLLGVDQDNPTLISYVREVHMRKYVNTPVYMQQPQHHHPQTPRTEEELEKEWDFHNRKEWTPIMAEFLSYNRPEGSPPGVFVSSLTGANDAYMVAPWLAMGANWTGVVVEPDPRRYFGYRKTLGKRTGVDVIHACLSPNKHPKEVTLRGEEEIDSDVKINSVLGGDDEDVDAWFHSRVKCFPLYTIMMATNRTKLDVLSIGCNGQHLQILKTLPFERIHIEWITLHFAYKDDKRGLLSHITNFLESKGYDLSKKFGTNYIYAWNGLIQPAAYSEGEELRDEDD